MRKYMDKEERARLFRHRLSARMAATGMSRSALARACGVDRSTIAQVLGGADDLRLPNAHLAAQCASALGVSADWLLGLSERRCAHGRLCCPRRFRRPVPPNRKRVGFRCAYLCRTLCQRTLPAEAQQLDATFSLRQSIKQLAIPLERTDLRTIWPRQSHLGNPRAKIPRCAPRRSTTTRRNGSLRLLDA